jgi:integrase/recombinase XerD
VKTPKVRIYIRIRRSDGTNAFVDPVWNRNRTLRCQYAMVDGVAQHHVEGSYYLRYKRDGKPRQWTPVGSDPDRAIIALRNMEHDLQAIGLGRSEPPIAEDVSEQSAEVKLSLADAVASYLLEVRRFRSPKTIAAAEDMLGRFIASLPDKALGKIKREDLLTHMFTLKQSGLGARTVHNHMCRIVSFLRSHDITALLRPGDVPKYDQKEVSAYNADELRKLFASCDPEERLLFTFLLNTGFREQEAMFCSWANVDFLANVVTVRSKPELGFRIQDKEERSIPVPNSLIEALGKRKQLSNSMLLFPNKQGKPNGHMLRDLQQAAHRAGLNCGECVTKGGVTCSARPVCGEWGLHKFRKTFATMHSEAGVSPRTIQRWLGHSDLATTLRYLAVADLRSERTRAQVNASFAAIALGSAA